MCYCFIVVIRGRYHSRIPPVIIYSLTRPTKMSFGLNYSLAWVGNSIIFNTFDLDFSKKF